MNPISRALWNATKSLWEEILQKGKFIPRAAASSSFPSPKNNIFRKVFTESILADSFQFLAHLDIIIDFKNILTNYNIGWLSAELLHDSLKAGVFANLSCGVDILDREEGTQPEQEYLGESSHELEHSNNQNSVM